MARTKKTAAPKAASSGLPMDIPEIETSEAAAVRATEPSEKEQTLLDRLHGWMRSERDRQAENRMQMAIDHDFFDGLQWSEEDAAAVTERGQAPLVFNEVAVGLRWIIGAEKRDRVDWKVLPRGKNDVELAQVKTEVLKFVSDQNLLTYARSAAFAECAISGESWLEDTLNPDASKDILYAGHQSWRTALGDSYDLSIDGSNQRYFFRWKDIDLDIASAMFPSKVSQLAAEAQNADSLFMSDQDELWYLGQRLSHEDTTKVPFARTVINESVNDLYNRRTRVRVYEAWYKVPEKVEIVRGGPFNGELYEPGNQALEDTIDEGYAEKVPSYVNRVYCAFFTDKYLLANYKSPFRHNEIPFTRMTCFRRGRDGMPYGFVRNMRDPQDDLNKRMSKSLFLLSVNQLIVDHNTFGTSKDDYTLQDAIDNVSNPAGVFVIKGGKDARFEIRRDYAEEQSQMNHVALDRQFMQSGGGVTDELLGRKTNATSGIAVEKRQDQGVLTTASVFDNYRLALRISGTKQLSNIEKFYTGPKVLRITEKEDGVENFKWLTVNEPELQPDGTVRFLNDITNSRHDYMVDEQDFRASMRQSMFEELSRMVAEIGKFNPMFAISMLDLVIDVADFPGKEEIVSRLRKLIAEARGQTPKSPEQAAAEAEQAELMARTAAAKIAKDEAAADKADAEADAIRVGLTRDQEALDLERTRVTADVALKASAQQQQAAAGEADLALKARQQQHAEQMGERQQNLAEDTAAQQGSMQQRQQAFSEDQAAQAAQVGGGGASTGPAAGASTPATPTPTATPAATPAAAPDPSAQQFAQAMAQMAQTTALLAQLVAQGQKTNAAVADALEVIAGTVEKVDSKPAQAPAPTKKRKKKITLSPDGSSATVEEEDDAPATAKD